MPLTERPKKVHDEIFQLKFEMLTYRSRDESLASPSKNKNLLADSVGITGISD